MAKSHVFKLRFDEDGILEGAEKSDGTNIPDQGPVGPTGNITHISVIVIHHTKGASPDWCWVQSGGRWFRIPC